MKRLYRSEKNRVVAGVSGGLADYFNIDPVIVRLLWIIFSLLYAVGIFVYLIAWFIVPEETEVVGSNFKENSTDDNKYFFEGQKSRMNSLGLILIIIGILFFLRSLIPFPFFNLLWPLMLVGLGVYLLAKDQN